MQGVVKLGAFGEEPVGADTESCYEYRNVLHYHACLEYAVSHIELAESGHSILLKASMQREVKALPKL